MSPLEIMDTDQWMDLLVDLANETLMAVMLTDRDGAVLMSHGDRPPLCEAIRGKDVSRLSICSQTNTSMLAVARRTLEPVVDECEGGMIRIAIPVVHDGVLIGQVATCGRIAHGGDVETFLVSKLLDVDETEVVHLARRSSYVAENFVQKVAQQYFARIDDSVRASA